tara:strand:+ start:54 stop:311 length:258 start_codon:yes stop_codon:yes gene_type:complete
MKESYYNELMAQSWKLSETIDRAQKVYPFIGARICELLIDLELQLLAYQTGVNIDDMCSEDLGIATCRVMKRISDYVEQDSSGTH